MGLMLASAFRVGQRERTQTRYGLAQNQRDKLHSHTEVVIS